MNVINSTRKEVKKAKPAPGPIYAIAELGIAMIKLNSKAINSQYLLYFLIFFLSKFSKIGSFKLYLYYG